MNNLRSMVDSVDLESHLLALDKLAIMEHWVLGTTVGHPWIGHTVIRSNIWVVQWVEHWVNSLMSSEWMSDRGNSSQRMGEWDELAGLWDLIVLLGWHLVVRVDGVVWSQNLFLDYDGCCCRISFWCLLSFLVFL